MCQVELTDIQYALYKAYKQIPLTDSKDKGRIDERVRVVDLSAQKWRDGPYPYLP